MDKWKLAVNVSNFLLNSVDKPKNVISKRFALVCSIYLLLE